MGCSVGTSAGCQLVRQFVSSKVRMFQSSKVPKFKSAPPESPTMGERKECRVWEAAESVCLSVCLSVSFVLVLCSVSFVLCPCVLCSVSFVRFLCPLFCHVTDGAEFCSLLRLLRLLRSFVRLLRSLLRSFVRSFFGIRNSNHSGRPPTTADDRRRFQLAQPSAFSPHSHSFPLSAL